MTTTTFHLPATPSSHAHTLFGDWNCRIERLDSHSCNIVFWKETEWKRFEEYAEEHDIEYSLV